MSKTKKDKGNTENDILKQYGDVIHGAAQITENPPPVISVSPKIDIALGGGIPEGSLCIFTGPEKVGKTLTALQFARNTQEFNADGINRRVIFANIEGRIKKRDLEGINRLDLNEEKFKIIKSVQGTILAGEDYVAIMEHYIHNQPNSLVIADSFSSLSSRAEMTNDIDAIQVAPMNKVFSKFTRRISNVLPINRVTIIGITHMMANISPMSKKSMIEKSGTALKYAHDVKLMASHWTPIMQGETQIGQSVHWKVLTSAIGAPGTKFTSHIKYGRGIWDEYEIAELAKDFGVMEVSGSWFTLPNGEKVQGFPKVCEYLEENPNAYSDLKSQVYEIVGMSV